MADFSDLGGERIDFSDLGGVPVQGEKKSLAKKAWDALAVPEQKSHEGLRMIADAVPQPEPQGKPGVTETALRMLYPGVTQNIQPGVIQDVVQGAPRIAADTMAEAAPGFISRGSLVTGGAAKAAGMFAPLAKLVIRGAGRQAEELSGIAPKAEGALEAAFKDPTLIFAKGKKAAGEFYEAAKDDLNAAKDTFRAVGTGPHGEVEMGKTSDILARQYNPEIILAKAEAFTKNGGKLEPAEALKVRKAIDALIKKRGNVPDELLKMREEYDAIAKSSKDLSTADALHQRGVQAEALRNIFPQNKYGGGSAFKLMLMDLMHKTGDVGKALSLTLSPIAQGTAATGAGILTRQALSPLVNSTPLSMALAAVLARRKQEASLAPQ